MAIRDVTPSIGPVGHGRGDDDAAQRAIEKEQEARIKEESELEHDEVVPTVQAAEAGDDQALYEVWLHSKRPGVYPDPEVSPYPDYPGFVKGKPFDADQINDRINEFMAEFEYEYDDGSAEIEFLEEQLAKYGPLWDERLAAANPDSPSYGNLVAGQAYFHNQTQARLLAARARQGQLKAAAMSEKRKIASELAMQEWRSTWAQADAENTYLQGKVAYDAGVAESLTDYSFDAAAWARQQGMDEKSAAEFALFWQQNFMPEPPPEPFDYSFTDKILRQAYLSVPTDVGGRTIPRDVYAKLNAAVNTYSDLSGSGRDPNIFNEAATLQINDLVTRRAEGEFGDWTSHEFDAMIDSIRVWAKDLIRLQNEHPDNPLRGAETHV